MNSRSTTFESFTLERIYESSPERVFEAWATPAAKARWFAGPKDGWKLRLREMDFSVGGLERLVGEWENGQVSDYQALYHDIVPNERIIYSYGMHLDGQRISVSLATITFTRTEPGTKLVLTEQGVFLDGYEHPGQRAHGTSSLLDALDRSLKRQPAER
jgi:uncharacterized protein YndB with AHSA1/START domain